MGPRPNNQSSSAKSTASKSSSAFKGIDDFLEKAQVDATEIDKQQLAAQSDEKAKALKEKYFDQFSPAALTQNLQQLDKCRTQSLIIGGITAGIFGFDGLQGMMFYVFLVLFVSLMISLRLGFDGKPYFMNLS